MWMAMRLVAISLLSFGLEFVDLAEQGVVVRAQDRDQRVVVLDG